MTPFTKLIKDFFKYKKDKDYITFKSSYFSQFIIGLGILSFIGNAAWLVKDIFVLGCPTEYIPWVLFFRLFSGLFLPFYFLTNKLNKRISWVLSFLIIWFGILGTFAIDLVIPAKNGFTGDGWITFYFFFFVMSLVSNRQLPIYISYIVYSILVVLTATDFGGPIAYQIPIIRPVSTGLILTGGLIIVSITIRASFIKLYLNEKILKDVSKMDILSKTWNRKKLEDVTDENYYLHRESTLFMIDIDYFKQINDNYGHVVGDEAIIKTAEILQSIVRVNDLVIRYGGDEFIVLYDGIIDEDVVYERILSKLKQMKTKYKLSYSIGTVRCTKDSLDLYASIKKADSALYISKDNGKGRMTRYEDILI